MPCNSARKPSRSCRPRPSRSTDPGRHHIHFAPRDGAQQTLHRRAILACAAAADTSSVERVSNDPAVQLCDRAQLVDLILGGLLLGGAADIERDMLWHDRIMLRRAAQRIGGTSAVAGTVVLLLLIPPHGILSDNEENYFVLAERFVDGNVWPRETAVFDASPHRTLSDATLGALVWAVGYTPAQVATRLLVVTAYALVLPPLFGAVGLAALDAAVVVMSMALIGQDLVGGEWLFSGYEAKVAAYILVLSALRIVLVGEAIAKTFIVAPRPRSDDVRTGVSGIR